MLSIKWTHCTFEFRNGEGVEHVVTLKEGGLELHRSVHLGCREHAGVRQVLQTENYYDTFSCDRPWLNTGDAADFIAFIFLWFCFI